MRIYLDIPYADSSRARRAKAKFDSTWHKWFVDDVVPADLMLFPKASFDDAVSTTLGYDERKRLHYVRTLACTDVDACPLAKEGTCVSVPSPHTFKTCPCTRHGRLTQSRLDKGFKARIEDMPTTGALTAPTELYFAHVGSRYTYLRMLYAHIVYDPDGLEERRQDSTVIHKVVRAKSNPDFVLDDRSGGQAIVRRDLVTPELIHEIVSMRPTEWGKPVTEFRRDYVPRLMDDIRRHDPRLFDAYQAAYGQVPRPSAIGRCAYLDSCAVGSVWHTYHGTLTLTEGTEDGRLALVSDDWKDLAGPIPGMRRILGAHLSIPVTPDMTIEITDDAQTTEATRFA